MPRVQVRLLECPGKPQQQGRSDGGYIGIYTPPQKKNQSTVQIFMWLLVVFFLFDPWHHCAVCYHGHRWF